MPQDSQDDKEKPAAVGRTYRDEVASPITTPEAVAARQVRQARYLGPDAVTIQVYFVVKQINNVILQASMLAYTDVRTASVSEFDEIFANHHEVKS